MERRSRIEGCLSLAFPSRLYWQRLWKIKIPRSVTLFLWRACNEVLLTKNNLFKRKVVPALVCLMCGIDAETTGHVLWWCATAQAVWGCCGGSINKSVVMKDDFFSIFCYLCDRLDTEELEPFAIIAHRIWLRRNSIVFGGPIPSPS